MKRCREEEEGAVDSLILLSQGVGGTEVEQPLHQLPSRVYECKTCNRQFHSFQALGGHRASHKKLRSIDEHPLKGETVVIKPKTHACSICGSEFAIGQALGGHMRRHRAATTTVESFSQSPVSKKSNNSRRVFGLDLNLTPFENEFQSPGLIGFDFAEKILMVDC